MIESKIFSLAFEREREFCREIENRTFQCEIETFSTLTEIENFLTAIKHFLGEIKERKFFNHTS